MIEIVQSRKTPTREIQISCKAKVVKANELLKYINNNLIVNKCRSGCPNYENKWSCPPYAKSYDVISSRYKYAIIICFSTAMEQYTDIKNGYFSMKAANSTLKSLTDKVAREIEKKVEGYALLCGSCRLCKSCECKQQKDCRHPERMRYSMESTGLEEDAIAKEELFHKILKYKNGIVPKYTTFMGVILSNCLVNKEQLARCLEFKEKN
ncbi:MAG: DUF2284 domain-containing protein [Solirubrobacterales bacterium]